MAIWAAVAAVSAGALVGGRGNIPAIAVATIAIAVSRRPRTALVLVSFGCGALVASFQARPAPLAAIALVVPSCEVEAIVLEHLGAFGSLISLHTARCEHRTYTGALGVALVSDLDADPGARLVGDAWLVPLRAGRADVTARRAGADARIVLRSHDVGSVTGALHRPAARVRGNLIASSRAISPRPAALLRGLTMGDTSGLDPDRIEAFRDSGLAHLLAVSGSNVAIVLGAALLLARNASLRVRVLLAAASLLMYVAVVGPDPSVLRAAAMGGLALIALLAGRTTEPLAALGVATAGVILFRPHMVHSAGLHLSVAATAGILLFGPRLAPRFVRLTRPVAVVLAATLGAQIAVAPVLVASFGEISLISPVANVLAAPAVPPATILGLAAALIHGMAPRLGHFLIRAAEPFAAWIEAVADRAAAVPFAAVAVPRAAALLIAVPIGWVAWHLAARRVG